MPDICQLTKKIVAPNKSDALLCSSISTADYLSVASTLLFEIVFHLNADLNLWSTVFLSWYWISCEHHLDFLCSFWFYSIVVGIWHTSYKMNSKCFHHWIRSTIAQSSTKKWRHWTSHSRKTSCLSYVPTGSHCSPRYVRKCCHNQQTVGSWNYSRLHELGFRHLWTYWTNCWLLWQDTHFSFSKWTHFILIRSIVWTSDTIHLTILVDYLGHLEASILH